MVLIGVVLLSPFQVQRQLSASEAKRQYGENPTVCIDSSSRQAAVSHRAAWYDDGSELDLVRSRCQSRTNRG